jgi:hypothetical protein
VSHVNKHAKGLDEPPHGMWLFDSFLPTLGPEFLPLEPRLSVQPHRGLWEPSRLTNLPSLFHESHSSGFPFGISIENVCEKVHSI